MPVQRESDINDFAYDYLRKHYITHLGVKNVQVNRAEKTKRGHTLDGLFSLRITPDKLFVASLHTNSSKQITSILLKYKKNGLSKLRYVTALSLFITISLITWKFAGATLVLAILTGLGMATTGFVLHTVLDKQNRFRKISNLVDALKLTPANEQWLGLSISSLAFRNNSLANKLLELCERRGIGLITVGKRVKVVIIKEPRPQTCQQGDFLTHYEAEQQIRKALLGDSYLRVA
ncbi:hypothetical protein [Pontibacter oryzae]|uniref:Uncharacterized protein n=1 Tax=Pontibacter oryzae TaxID=2304593 RepID=A0A399SIQ8_9BACT|nr:hypothetical protein [Pontibacter oryzae]RIJ42841.1 hypothetical protein D1627_03055 [Pontibacter oryzae]